MPSLRTASTFDPSITDKTTIRAEEVTGIRPGRASQSHPVPLFSERDPKSGIFRPMHDYSQITVNDIRELRQQLMTALDDLSELEHRVQRAHHIRRKAGKVVQAIRSWQEQKPPAPESSSKTRPANPIKVKFLTVVDLAERWGCCTQTVKRMVRANLISQTYLGARTVRISIEEIERYERECRG